MCSILANMKLARRPYLLPLTLKITGVGLLVVGVYVLLTALTPAALSPTINPVSNPTVEKLSQTKPHPLKNQLYIPQIDINLPFAAGDENVMLTGAWWRSPQSGNPKDGGNFVLSAHRFIMSWTPGKTLKRSPFYNIDKLKVGDEITIDYQNERYVYVVDKTYSVTPEAIEIEAPTDDNRLTLYSCTLSGASDGRDVIIAKLRI